MMSNGQFIVSVNTFHHSQCLFTYQNVLIALGYISSFFPVIYLLVLSTVVWKSHFLSAKASEISHFFLKPFPVYLKISRIIWVVYLLIHLILSSPPTAMDKFREGSKQKLNLNIVEKLTRNKKKKERNSKKAATFFRKIHSEISIFL